MSASNIQPMPDPYATAAARAAMNARPDTEPDVPFNAMALLVNAARVSPPLRAAMAEVESYIEFLAGRVADLEAREAARERIVNAAIAYVEADEMHPDLPRFFVALDDAVAAERAART